MTTDMIRFDVLVQDALRGVVRKVLGEVARTGLPGDHHFFISFDTTHPGVRVSSRVRQRYPEEMTIVLQHQFWDLNVTETGFEVGLSFGGIPEKLSIPYTAVKGFFDPSVQFGLQFEVVRDGEDAGDGVAASPAAEDKQPRLVPVAATPARSETPAIVPAAVKDTPKPAIAEVPKPAAKEAPKDGAGKATVVSLDQFRKKP